MARVDAIIPYFNTPTEFARVAIQSVLAQTFTDLNCIVVNDGSASGFTSSLESLLQSLHDPRITYLKTTNAGAAAARNAGIRAGESSYIALLDSDDAWHPDRLALQVPLLDRNPGVALVHARHEDLLVDGKIIATASKAYLNDLSQPEQLLQMLRENIVSVGTSIFRRSAAQAIGLFDEVFRNIEDKDFFLRLLIAGYNFLYLDEVVTVYRHHASNKSGNIDRMITARLRVIQKMDQVMPFRKDLCNVWPCIRRNMLRHVSQEAAEKCLERGDYWQALRHSLAPRGGPSWNSGKLALAAAQGLMVDVLGRR